MLYAAGSVWGERALVRAGNKLQKSIRVLVWAVLVADVVIMGAITLPIAPANSTWATHAMKINGDFREELGWLELVQTIAQIRDSLSTEEQAQLGILTGNYGEAGAVNLYGPQSGLPRAISGVNSFWQRGYCDRTPETLILGGCNIDCLH